MLNLEAIHRPSFLINSRICQANIQSMADRAKRHDLIFRPHFKTHQSAEVARWFKSAGVTAITVSSMEMACFFMAAGWLDITVAFPVNLREIRYINTLADKIQLNLLVDNPRSTAVLGGLLEYPVGLFLKIDTGYGRAGIFWQDGQGIRSVLSEIHKSPLLSFKGFLTHSGHTYNTGSPAEVLDIHSRTLPCLGMLKNQFAADFPEMIISIGDTPSCSIAEDFTGIDEIRPGNFVFYDAQQFELGVCHIDQIAVCVACPVVGKYPERGELVIYGGAVHFSKDSSIAGNTPHYGFAAILDNTGWKVLGPGNFLKSLSQEHGIVKLNQNHFTRFEVGDLLGILPAHSCLTNDLLKDHTLIF